MKFGDIKLNKTINQLKILVFGSSMAFLINVIGLYFYSKLFSADQFGILAIFVSSATVVSLFSTLGMDYVIVLQRTVKEAALIRDVCETIVTYFSIAILLLVVILISIEFSFYSFTFEIMMLFPFALYSVSMINVYLNWNNKIKNYKVISIYRFIQSISVMVLSIILGFFEVEIGLVLAYSVSVIASHLFMLVSFKKNFSFSPINVRTVRHVLINNKDVISYSYGTGLIFNFSRAMPIFLLGHYFGNGIVGLYSMCIRILNIPKNLVSVNIGELFYQKGSILFAKRDRFKILARNTFFILLIVSVLGYNIFSFWGVELFTFFLGEEWKVSGELSEVISIWYMILFISSPLAYIFYIDRALKVYFWYSLISVFIKCLFLYVMVISVDAMQSIYFYSYLCILLEFIFLIIVLKKLFKKHD